MSVIGTIVRRIGGRLPARRRPAPVEVMRYWPEMDDSGRRGRCRYALLCLAATAVMTTVFMAAGIKFIKVRQALEFQHHAEPDAMSANADASRLPRKNVLANSGVLKLKAAGFGDDLIVQRIKMSRADYQLEPEDLSDLKKAGLSDVVISAMMTAAVER